MSDVDIWFFLILCPIAIIECLTLFYFYIRYRDMRQSPADLYMASIFFSFTLGIHWFLQALYNLMFGPMLTTSILCQTSAVSDILGTYGIYFYSLAFFHYIAKKMKSSFSSDKVGTLTCHLAIFVTLWLLVLVFAIIKVTGKTLNGQCGIQYIQLDDITIIFLSLLLLTPYLSVAGYSYYNLHQSVNQVSKHKLVSGEFLKFSQFYFMAYFLLEILIRLADGIAGLNCTYFWNENLVYFYTLGNVLKCVQIICLPIVVIFDPQAKSIFAKSLDRRTRAFSKSELNDIEITQTIQDKNDSNQVHDISQDQSNSSVLNSEDGMERDLHRNQSIIRQIRTETQQFDNQNASIELSQEKTEEKKEEHEPDSLNFVSLMQNNIRTSIMFKIVCSLLIDDKCKYNQIELVEALNLKSENIFEDKKVYSITNDDIFENIPDIPPQSFFDAQNATVIKMTSYSSIIFHSLMCREKETVKLQESLDILENLARLKQSGKNDGGKSGQFFFFSQDNKLMIKTISQSELKILLSKLQEYYVYLQANSDSLIAKIYGIFTFEGLNERPIHIILMKNLARGNKACIQRIYDLKGSSFDREVIKKLNPTDKELGRSVLKDLDFLKFEKKIDVSEEDCKKINDNASADAQFFMRCGLIDYSIIVFKIDWEKMVSSHPETAKFLEEKGQHVYKSIREPNVTYHIGIIDYLQEYDVQKKMEKFSKKLIKLNRDLDTSSQDPTTYSTRFTNFVRNITVLQQLEQHLIQTA